MQLSADLIARQPVCLMDEPTFSDEINTVDNLYRIFEPRWFITTNHVFICSYYLWKSKNKKKGSLLKIGVWLLMLLVMHTQTTLNQGLLHTIDLGSEDKRRMRKNPCMQLYIRFKMERIRTKDLTLLIVIELSIFLCWTKKHVFNFQVQN